MTLVDEVAQAVNFLAASRRENNSHKKHEVHAP